MATTTIGASAVTNGGTGTSSSLSTIETVQTALHSRLVESGEYDRLLDLLKSKLDQVGWEDQLRGVAREKARYQNPPNLPQLAKELEPTALDSIPKEVKDEIEAAIQAFVEKNVE